METINVLITMPFSDNLLDKLASVSPRLSIEQHVARSPAELPGDLGDVAVLYTSRALPNPEDAPELSWVQLHSAGINHVQNTPLYTDTDIIITTASGIHAVNMAEYVLAQMLAFAHHIPLMIEDRRHQNWPEDRWERYVPRELRGKTVGIVGYGSVGREVARLASTFGMDVLAVKHDLRQLEHTSYRLPETGDPEALLPTRIYPVSALKSFLKECDYVVLTIPLTDATHHLVDRQALDAMKPDAILINVSRGGVVAEGALITALQEQAIGGAALDVFQNEPLPESSPLWGLPNVILSPHVSGFTPHYDDRAVDLFAENLRRYVVGEPLINLVDRQRGY